MKLQPEQREQEAIFYWANIMLKRYPVLKWLHSSQSGAKRSAQYAKQVARSGLKKGIPDIFLPVKNKNYGGLYIELKRKEKSLAKVSPEQKEFLEFALSQNYLAKVCYGAKEAIELIENYLKEV